jgi:myo-inositol-hexaphosphate 3-phosphohydrolase
VVEDPAGELADAVEGVAAEYDEDYCHGGGYGIFAWQGMASWRAYQRSRFH